MLQPVQYSKYISVFPRNHFRGADPCSNGCRAASISDLHLRTSTQFQGTNTLSRKKKIIRKSPHRFIARPIPSLAMLHTEKQGFSVYNTAKLGIAPGDKATCTYNASRLPILQF